MRNESKRTVIAVNLLFIFPGRNRGTLTYVVGFLRQWQEMGVEVILLLHSQNAAMFASYPFKKVVVKLAGGSRITRVICEQLLLPFLSRRLGADVLFCPGYTSPIVSSVTTVTTIPDMQFRDIPKQVPWGTKLLNGLVIPLAVESTGLVLTISEFSKNQIIKHLKINPRRIAVTHLAGVEMTGRVREGRLGDRFAALRETPYFVVVSSSAPYKNVERVIEAFLQYRRAGGTWHLALVGQHLNWCPLGEVPPETAGVHSLGFVSESDLVSLYQNSGAFILASSYEGFGLPVLEAQALEVPVIASSRASLPEVLGNSALYVDPDDLGSITAALLRVAGDPLLRQELVALGRANVKRFSWRKCAEETFLLLQQVGSETGCVL